LSLVSIEIKRPGGISTPGLFGGINAGQLFCQMENENIQG